MSTINTFSEQLDLLPIPAVMEVMRKMVNEVIQGHDPTLAALRVYAEAIGAEMVVVGGIAVIVYGYRRPTQDRYVLVDQRHADELAFRLMDDPDWERQEIRQYAFLYRPTGIRVDFLVSGHLASMGRPYVFPRPQTIHVEHTVEGIPVIGLHDLLWMKLLAGRMRDLADLMEICKRHLAEIDPEKVLFRLQPEDDDLRQQFLDILRKAPIELENERRLGQLPPGDDPPENQS